MRSSSDVQELIAALKAAINESPESLDKPGNEARGRVEYVLDRILRDSIEEWMRDNLPSR